MTVLLVVLAMLFGGLGVTVIGSGLTIRNPEQKINNLVLGTAMTLICVSIFVYLLAAPGR